MPARKEKITPERFVQLLTEQVLERSQFSGMYDHFSATVPKEQLSEKHFCEFLILSLFLDHMCLSWSLDEEAAGKLRGLYVTELMRKLEQQMPVPSRAQVDSLWEERFPEYRSATSQIGSVNIDTQRTLDSLTSLGEAFSKHFIGHENIEIILKVKWLFFMKEDILYEDFLQEIERNYELPQ